MSEPAADFFRSSVVSDPTSCRGRHPFDVPDVPARCRELLHRISLAPASSDPPPWKWDILELLQESRDALKDVRQANSSASSGSWREIGDAVSSEHDATTIPVALRRQCEDLVGRREAWVDEFTAELKAIVARGWELRERLLFEDSDRAGWFSAAGVSPVEVQRLLEDHLEMHQRGVRLTRQLQMLGRALRQQGAVSSRRRAFAVRTVGEKLQSSITSLAAITVAPVPGSTSLWLARTATMWLGGEEAWQHVVYEHPRDAATETILDQFQCRSSKAREALAIWSRMPLAKRRGNVLIHNASVRRVFVKTHLMNCIDGQDDTPMDWRTAALDEHPYASLVKKAMNSGSSEGEDKVVIGAQRLAVVPLPAKPDMNWSWRGAFSYGDTRVGECRLLEGGVFSFICVDCGLRVGDGDDDAHQQAPALQTSPEGPQDDIGAQSDSGGVAEKVSSRTTVKVVNHMEETVQVKIFEPSPGAHPAVALFRRPLAEHAVSPAAARLFAVEFRGVREDTYYEVEVRVGGRKATCEVVGGQVVFVDGIFSDV